MDVSPGAEVPEVKSPELHEINDEPKSEPVEQMCATGEKDATASGNHVVETEGGIEFLVTWQDEESDLGNPKNWAMRRKARALVGMSMFVFISVFAVSLIAPGLPAVSSDLHIEQPAVQEMVLSIFLLGYTFGPLVASPLSETFGRMRVIQFWNLLYTIFNALCGASQSKEALIVLRFISGVFASATLGIGGGTISDLFRSKDRGKGVAIYSWCAVAGPLFGVILGGFIAKYTTWRWAFFSTSILSACIQLIGLYMLEETYPPLLLRRRKWSIIKETGDTRYYTLHDHLDHVTARVLSQNLIRPFKLLATQPIIQVMALYNGFLYGNTYIFFADFVNLFTNRYHESVQIAGLNYVSIATSSGLATVIYSMTIDRIYRILSSRNGGQGKPEFRIPVMVPGTLLLGIGLFWYGWSADAVLHWIMPNIGCGLFIAGATICTSSVNAYIVDTYGQYSASAIAAISILRCLAGFTFPLFAPYMYDKLGYGWAATVLGFIALGIGFPVLGLLWKFGLYLRHKSPYSSAEKVPETRVNLVSNSTC
ncbi:synaptic vesicle transporter [Mollisia scopiformis]|uniref:Synaptic vesicle transporter n=1 Tax=Mollisia scopiformis TaxID=149040 RepID=A0A194XPK1_MOLSC|nr:synaptic vesicle transporter [Mollisia scopiformis]KUJ21667.1 synaptic vesicle transporter [Mollisia scopiformis]